MNQGFAAALLLAGAFLAGAFLAVADLAAAGFALADFAGAFFAVLAFATAGFAAAFVVFAGALALAFFAVDVVAAVPAVVVLADFAGAFFAAAVFAGALLAALFVEPGFAVFFAVVPRFAVVVVLAKISSLAEVWPRLSAATLLCCRLLALVCALLPVTRMLRSMYGYSPGERNP